jgi:hypothetical protein
MDGAVGLKLHMTAGMIRAFPVARHWSSMGPLVTAMMLRRSRISNVDFINASSVSAPLEAFARDEVVSPAMKAASHGSRGSRAVFAKPGQT